MATPDTSRVPRASLKISSVERPGWGPAEGREPSVGEQIYCVEGPAEVVRLLGKTSDGSRLLELRRPDQTQPFFAASSNVLVRTEGEDPQVFLKDSDGVGAG